MLKILLTTASTGAGKTDSCVTIIIKLVKAGETVVLAQPTKALNEQTARVLVERNSSIHITIINGDTVDSNISYKLASHLASPPDYAHVIITTTASFERLPFLKNAANYHLIVDEVPNAFKVESIQIPRHHKLLTDSLTIIPRGPTYAQVSISDDSSVRTIAENRRSDAIDELLKPIANTLLDVNFTAYVNTCQYEEFLRGSRDESHLTVFFLRRPTTYERFKSVRMIGARADETVLVKWFKQQGVVFELDVDMMSGLRYTRHENGHLIDFYYGSERNFSFYDQERHPQLRLDLIAASKRMMADKEFAWIDNKRNEDGHEFSNISDAKHLPHNAHGRNDFQNYDNLVVLTSLNYDTASSAFLNDVVGMTKDEQKVAFDYHSTYQTLSRISVRNPNNHNRKTIILPDRRNAEWQSRVFPGSRVLSLCIDDRKTVKRGRPQIYANANERKRANRQKLKNEQNALIKKYDLGNARINEAGYHMSCHEITYNNIIDNVTGYQGSLVRSRFDKETYPVNMSIKGYGSYMKALHKRVIADKNDNHLIMSALCIPNDKTGKAKENAIWGKHIYIDFDDTELKPLLLSRIFPNCEIICYNSYSNSKDRLRYRAVFLTDGLMSPDAYTFLWRQIVQRIEDAGYQSQNSYCPKGKRKLHGIDNKPCIVDAFYVPCQAASGASFYYHYTKGRKPINVEEWIQHPISTRFDSDYNDITLSMIFEIRNDSLNQSDYVKDALNRYRSAISNIDQETGKLGSSNKALFILNNDLKRAKVEDWERDAVLTQAANESRSPSDRLNDKRRYMKQG